MSNVNDAIRDMMAETPKLSESRMYKTLLAQFPTCDRQDLRQILRDAILKEAEVNPPKAKENPKEKVKAKVKAKVHEWTTVAAVLLVAALVAAVLLGIGLVGQAGFAALAKAAVPALTISEAPSHLTTEDLSEALRQASHAEASAELAGAEAAVQATSGWWSWLSVSDEEVELEKARARASYYK